MNLVTSLMLEIRSGKLRFQPKASDEDSLREFQLVAKALVHAHELGLVGRVQTHKNATTGEWLIDYAWVDGGLTYRGELFLDQNRKSLPLDSATSSAMLVMNGDTVHKMWQTALERRGSDPEGAITAAKTLLESVCKHILDAKAIIYDPGKIELHELYKLTADSLPVAPSPETKEIFKQVLGGCSAVINGVGAIRNKLGDAHGKDSKSAKPMTRHAELAVNLAGSMSMFLVTTFLESR